MTYYYNINFIPKNFFLRFPTDLFIHSPHLFSVFFFFFFFFFFCCCCFFTCTVYFSCPLVSVVSVWEDRMFYQRRHGRNEILCSPFSAPKRVQVFFFVPKIYETPLLLTIFILKWSDLHSLYLSVAQILRILWYYHASPWYLPTKWNHLKV